MPRGIYPRIKINSGLFLKGQKAWNKGLKDFRKGHEVSVKVRKKISKKIKQQWANGEKKLSPNFTMKGKKHTEEAKNKIKQWLLNNHPFKGKHHSEETKSKISKTKKKNPVRYWLGKKFSEDYRKKMSLAQRGEKSHCWKGGISFEPYSVDWTETLKRSIRERDNYICQLCSQYGNAVHHIDYNKKNCNPDNLITLCVNCNSKVNYNRDYWIQYFNNIIKNL